MGDIVVSSYVRFAAGVCVLSTGLFMGAAGGAIAAADTDASDSSATGDDSGSSQGSGTASSTAPSTTSSPVGSITDSLQKSLQGVMSTFGSGRTPGLRPSTGADSSTVEPGGSTETADENVDSGAAVASAVEPVPTVVEPVTNVEPVPSVVVEPAPTADASAPSVVAVPNVVAPVATVVTGLVGTTSAVIALVESMATSAAGAALVFTSLQPDLSALLGMAGVDPVRQGVEGHGGMGPSATADVFLTALQSPVVPLQTGIPGVTWADRETGAAPLEWGGTTLLGQESPLPEAGSGSDGLIPVGVRKLFQQAFDEIRRSPALAALLAAALPGVGGLLFLTGAGMRLGYRQAKAGFALRIAGTARFAPSGPIGVVRSGSLVFVRPRALHVVRPGTSGAGCVLDEAA